MSNQFKKNFRKKQFRNDLIKVLENRLIETIISVIIFSLLDFLSYWRYVTFQASNFHLNSFLVLNTHRHTHSHLQICTHTNIITHTHTNIISHSLTHTHTHEASICALCSVLWCERESRFSPEMVRTRFSDFVVLLHIVCVCNIWKRANQHTRAKGRCIAQILNFRGKLFQSLSL